MRPRLQSDWERELHDEFKEAYYLRLQEFLKREYQTHTIYPSQSEIYTALEVTSYRKTKVVILGQDPYHGPGQAHGLSFSVKPDVPVPPSLRNIFKELQGDVGCFIPNHGHLMSWAEQGVLLLNRVLTVQSGCPNSHKGQGWEAFTDAVIARLNRRAEPVVFILWGSQAQQKAVDIDSDKHCVIQAPHPSPLSAHRGFFGSRPFSQTNSFLQSIGVQEIDWQIQNV